MPPMLSHRQSPSVGSDLAHFLQSLPRFWIRLTPVPPATLIAEPICPLLNPHPAEKPQPPPHPRTSTTCPPPHPHAFPHNQNHPHPPAFPLKPAPTFRPIPPNRTDNRALPAPPPVLQTPPQSHKIHAEPHQIPAPPAQ